MPAWKDPTFGRAMDRIEAEGRTRHERGWLATARRTFPGQLDDLDVTRARAVVVAAAVIAGGDVYAVTAEHIAKVRERMAI